MLPLTNRLQCSYLYRCPCTAATIGSSRGPDLSDVKIYKRSKDGVAPIVGRSDSTGTLQGHSVSAGRQGRSPAAIAAGYTGSLAAATAKDYPELVRRQLRWDSNSLSETRSSVRASAASSPATVSFKGYSLRR